MASIVADRIRIEYPILDSMNRSIKRRFVSAATGGLVARDARDHVVVTALNDVSLTISQGERVALVGHNGSGKSTLLRSIAGVYRPLAGELRVQGSISTLFDISTGFDLEATGYENIVLRGLVMGMTRAQVAQRMSEIREFSGLGDYLELPIRTYSSGMVLRLAFAVATSVQVARRRVVQRVVVPPLRLSTWTDRPAEFVTLAATITTAVPADET